MKSVTQLYGPPKTGGDTLSFCTKCRMELAHVIVSMLDGKPSKVQCKTCKGVHKYKTSGNAVPVRRTPGTRTTVPKQVIRVAEVWEQKISAKSKADVADYKTSRKFAVGEVVQHPNFGLGIVEEVRTPTKMAVLFREGEKILVHGL
jgi:hypothetical protein